MLDDQNQKFKNLEALESIKNLYPDLIDVMASPETSSTINEIVAKYELEKPGEFEIKSEGAKSFEESSELTKDLPSPKIAQILGQVFLGQLNPKNLSKTIQEELKIGSNLADNIVADIDDLIFSKVKRSLNKLYETEKKISSEVPEGSQGVSSERPASKGKDVYRETIE